MVGIFGNSNIGIGVSIGLINRFSGPAAQVTQSYNQMTAAQQRMYRQNLEMTRNVNAVGAGLGVAALRGIGQWTRVGAEFKYIMASVGAVTQSTDEQLKGLSSTSRTLGKDTMFTAQEVASGMKFMGMAGMNALEIQKNIKAAVSLAGATQSSLGGKGGSADIMTNVMKAFGAKPEQAMRYADILTTATVSANTSLWDLGEALKYSSSTLKTLNYGVEDAAMMVGVLGNAGIQGSMAGTAIENMVRYITKAAGEFRTGKQGEALKILGLQPQQLGDAQGNLKNLKDILKLIGGQVAGMGNIQRQNAMNQIFGVRGNRAAALLVNNLQDVDTLFNKITNSGGTSNNIMLKMMDTLRGKTLQLRSAWDDFKISYTEALEPVLKLGAVILTKILKGLTAIFNTPYLGKFLAMGITGFIALKTAHMAWAAVSAGMRLMFATNSIAFNGYRALVVRSYAQMATAASTYGAAASAANMAATSSGAASMVVGGALTRNSAGRIIGRAGTNRAGQFVSGALAGRYMSRYGSRVTGTMFSRGMGWIRNFFTVYARPAFMGIVRFIPTLLRVFGPIVGVLSLFYGALSSDDGARRVRKAQADERARYYESKGLSSMDYDPVYEYKSAMNRGDYRGQQAARIAYNMEKYYQNNPDKRPNFRIHNHVFVDNEEAVKKEYQEAKDQEYFSEGFN